MKSKRPAMALSINTSWRGRIRATTTLILWASSMLYGLVSAHATIVVGPILEGVTTSNAYVLVECTAGATSPMTNYYGLTTDYGSVATTAFTRSTGQGTTNVHRIKLTGLTPNTLYHYKLAGQGTNTPDYTFRTPVSPGAPFRFVWQADFRSTPTVHDQISWRILNTDKPLFVVEGGDTSYNGDWAGWHNEFFTSNEMALGTTIPIYPTPGNHEGWGTLTQAYDQSPDSTGNPGDALGYYSFDCGDVHFTLANFMYAGGYAVGSAQYNWIQQDVQGSLKPWKIFCAHAPAYTYGGSGAHGGDAGFQAITKNILEPNGVKVYLAGHNHFYQHNLVNGIRHLTVGSAGATLHAVSSNTTYTLKAAMDNSYLVVDVSPTNFSMVAYNNFGIVLDAITNLVKLPAPTNLTATPGVGQVTLNWNPVANATNYSVWYRTNVNGNYTTKQNSTVTSTTVTGLTNNRAYYFVVTAGDANGASAISAEVSATPTNPAPLIGFTNLSNGAFTLSGNGAANQAYVLLYTMDVAPPVNWTPLQTNWADTNGAFQFTDLQATNSAQGFYRVTTP
jgi:hypothetical protein